MQKNVGIASQPQQPMGSTSTNSKAQSTSLFGGFAQIFALQFDLVLKIVMLVIRFFVSPIKIQNTQTIIQTNEIMIPLQKKKFLIK
jgi:hypothetical protein